MDAGIILWLIGLTGLVALAIRWSSKTLDELDDIRKELRNADHRTDESDYLKGYFND